MTMTHTYTRTETRPAHIMIDLETLGTTPGSVILSIGAVAFDPIDGFIESVPETHDGRFSANVDIQSAIDYGLTVDGSTIEWWHRQKKSAWDKHREKILPLGVVLSSFGQWVDRFKDPQAPDNHPRVWGNGATFDISLLDAAYDRVKILESPYSHRHVRCYRTLRRVARMHGVDTADHEETTHVAVEDAARQVRTALRIFAALRSMAYVPNSENDAELEER